MVFETKLPGLCASLSLSLTAFVCTSKGDSELNRNLGNFANLIVTNRSQNHISYKLMHYSRTLVAFNWQRGEGILHSITEHGVCWFFFQFTKIIPHFKLKARRIPEHFIRFGLICTLSYDVINLILLVLFFTDVNQTTCIECSEGKALNLSCKDSIRQVPCSSQCFTVKGNITYFYKPDEVITTAIEGRGCANCTGKYI